MAVDFGMQQKTICGYHKKNTGKIGIIDKKHPMLENEEEAIFLVTRDHFFSISTQQITSVLANFKRYKKFNDTKATLASILIIPGVLVAIGFVLKYAGLLATIPTLLAIINSKISSALFGLSILAVLLLWHDFYQDKSHPIQLPNDPKISQKELEEIKATGFKFGRYAHLEIINFANEETLELLCDFTKNNTFSVYEIYKHLIKENFEVQQIIRRSGIEVNWDEMENDFKVNTETLPTYQVTAFRSLLTYAVEEALLSESSQLEPQHIFWQ